MGNIKMGPIKIHNGGNYAHKLRNYFAADRIISTIISYALCECEFKILIHMSTFS